MSQEQIWVIAYDTPSANRRRKLAKVLEGSGVRMQWSVFECRLQPHQLSRLRHILERIVEPIDSVRLWPLSQRTRAATQLGSQFEPPSWQDKVI
jgi:CRISPR-associated protein Cas2